MIFLASYYKIILKTGFLRKINLYAEFLLLREVQIQICNALKYAPGNGKNQLFKIELHTATLLFFILLVLALKYLMNAKLIL